VFKTLVEYITEVEAVSNPEGTILSVIQLIKKTAEGSGDATKFSMPRFLNHLKNAGLDIDYAGFKGYYDASPSIQNSIGQFTEKEISFGSDEDSESSETMGKPEGKMPPAEKVAQMANRAVKARESASDSLMDVENPVKEEVELDEAKNYEIKNGKIHISKANFRKVHKDYKNSTKGKERMMALDPKSGATTSYEVVFEEVELDEVGGAAFGGTIDKIQKVVDDKTAMKIDGVMVDTFTASLIMNIFKKVNKQNQDKMRKMKVTQLANAAYKLSGMKEEVELDEAEDYRKDYETFAKIYAKLNKAVDDASAKLKKFPKGNMGMTPDKVKSDPKYKKAKAEYERVSNLTKKFLKGVPKDFMRKYSQSIRLRREETE